MAMYGRHMAKGRICKISLFQVLTFGKVLEGALFIYRTLEIANLLVFKIAGRICSTFFQNCPVVSWQNGATDRYAPSGPK